LARQLIADVLPTAAEVAARIAAHPSATADRCWAAVAVALADGDRGPEVLLVRRARRDGDRWSGDMALPGGKVDPTDPSPEAAAAREAWEETRVAVGEPAARLDDVVGRPTSHRIAPVVFVLDGRQDPVPAPAEVDDAFWWPLAELADPANSAWFRYGGIIPFPAIAVGDNLVWGLTHRILTSFLAIGGLT
jgi:8-oxo-dGTP pyrophosphatase MutT (NUDIX family)